MNELKAPVHQFNELVLDARLSTDNINKAAIDERFYFEKQAPETLSELDAAIQGLRPIEQNVAGMTAHGKAAMDDVQIVFDRYAHPPKKKLGFWGSVYAGAQVVHKLSPPLF